MTKLIAIELDGGSTTFAFENEQLKNFGQLLQIGCFGELEANAAEVHAMLLSLSEQLASAGKAIFTVSALAHDAEPVKDATTSLSALSLGRHRLGEREWDFVHIVELGGDDTGQHQHLDTELGELLQALDDDTAVLILRTRNERSFFILAIAHRALNGAVESVRVGDLWVTLLDITGIPMPDAQQGTSLLNNGLDDNAREILYTPEDEAVIYERLAGLGYIG